MRFMNTLVFASLAAAAVASADAAAETLYKLVAPDGKVTYVQEPPKNFDGKVIRLDIDTSANTAAGRKQAPGQATNEAIIRSNPEAPRVKQLDEAQARLEAARKAYETARDNPGEGDVQRIGNKGGGARPVFSDEYRKKLEKLEADMKQAQAEVDRLERGR